MPSRVALPIELLQARAQGANALRNQASIGLQLGFARAAQSDAALLPLKVSPAPHQPRRQMRQLREFDLKLALEAARALREDV